MPRGRAASKTGLATHSLAVAIKLSEIFRKE
jgi:hypothetical protein